MEIGTWRPGRRRAAVAALVAAALASVGQARADAAMDAAIEALVPDLETYIEKGMHDFDAPAVVMGIVSGDRLAWSSGFGVASKGGAAVDDDTIFQIGSTTKAFLATTIAIAVDEGRLAWDDRVVDRHPGFQMKDPWVSQEFRVFDLLAQRSGLPPAANDALGFLGVPPEGMIDAMRNVEPASSFRSTFAYTNVTHMLAGEVVAEAMGAPDWGAVVTEEILRPLGMTRSSLTAAAIEAAENATVGHRYDPDGSVEVPFTQIFPYDFAGAGAINSTLNDLVPWVRLQLSGGMHDQTRIVSAENLAVTRIPRIGMAPTLSYAMGWVQQVTPHGLITWHNGGTTGYGAFIGLLPDRNTGVVVLTNLQNVGLPDAIGEWTLDRLLGNPEVDHVAHKLEQAKAAAADVAAVFARPADPAAPPALDGLAGVYTNVSFGATEVAVDGDGLMATIAGTGARLRLAPWSGDALTVSLVPEGRFAAIAANLGPTPVGFAQFRVGGDGRIAGFDFVLQEDGQTLRFDRNE
ncbi:serine hydrolase [Amaricoccus sp.]|uniref:serine hydrolase n=1 Tax=Amaricoccus sp. TaxID=1872485 RepID=UPI001B634971|nr:serine hydrolase [Amaricoccus sp.]MBP7000603.1 serine hydrolase [Amaricoccus sp.]